MNSLVLVLGPAVASLGLVIPPVRARAPQLFVTVAVIASALAYIEVLQPSRATLFYGYVHVDAMSRLFLAFVNPIILGISLYIWNRVASAAQLQEGLGKFVGLLLIFVAASNAALIANHLWVLWITLEVTTLAAAPLIIFHRPSRARFASFRYLLFSSVGLGLVLLGFVCLARGIQSSDQIPNFFLDQLETLSTASANRWGKLGVALVLLGLGTKLGLAPMYAWLPETYDEAPPAVTALLGAVQFNVALVVLLRVVHVFRPAHPGLITSELVAMGVASMVVSTVSIIATRNMTRLIAYASINHAGVIAIGLGIGKSASYGLLLYVISNAFIKAILFLTAGKIKAHYETPNMHASDTQQNDTQQITGLLKDLPYSGMFLMVGTFALLGFPPFGSFFGELLILSALVSSGHMFVFGMFCVLITMTFVATGRTIFPMIWGAPKQTRTWPRQTFVSAVPKLLFLVALVVLGVYIPPVVNDLIVQVATYVGAT